MSAAEDWIGRTRLAEDRITPRLAAEFRATLGPMHCAGPLSPGLHWCLCPEIAPASDLGRDGHPRTGLILPDLGLPRRMWAGGRVVHHGALAVDQPVTRATTVRDITHKEGRSGKLAFLALEHRYLVDGLPRIEEVHDIVYRPDPDAAQPLPAPPRAEAWPGAEGREVTPDATLLFRYSALTFNGHRIHYDAAYAREVEGYAGLVVHGPMQATWMLHLATDLLGGVPGDFRYRGRSPLTCPVPEGPAVRVEARRTEAGLSLRVRDLGRDVVTMTAEAAPPAPAGAGAAA